MNNIAFFSGDITRNGGTERVTTLIANELQKNEKYNISIISLTERNDDIYFNLDKSIPHYKLYDKVVSGLFHFMGYTKRLKNIIRENNIDLLIDIDGIIDMYSVPIRKKTGVKIISWEHFNVYHHPNPWLRKVVRKYAVPRVDAIVTLTEEDKGYYEKEFNIKCPIQSIYNPVIWKQETHEYDINSKILLSAGRLTNQKGFDISIEVAKNVMTKNPDWKWIILGEGEDRQLLEKKIQEYGLVEQVLLPGNKNNIEDYYMKSSMFVMTSRYEGLPMTLLETKPYKLPIVSFKCKTGPSELVRDGINGYLIKENDIEGMSTKINELINDSNKRIDFSENALLDTEKFKLDSIIKQWETLIDKIVND